MTVPLGWREGELRLRSRDSAFFDTTLDLVQAMPDWAATWSDVRPRHGFVNQAYVLPTRVGPRLAFVFPMGLN